MGANIGATAIAGAYVGTTAVSKIYKGSTEIWSGSTPPIPTGTQYGKVYYYSDFTNDYYIDNEENCMIDIMDSNALFDFLARIGIDETIDTMPYDIVFTYDGADDMWTCHGSDLGGMDEQFMNDEIESTAGLMCDFFGKTPEVASFHIIIDIDVDTTSASTSYELVSSADYDLLNDKMSYGLNSEYLQLPRLAIVSFEFGYSVTTTPCQFLRKATNLTSIDLTYASSLTSIGAYFLQECTGFNMSLAIPNTVTFIDNSFLSGCSNFDSPLTLPSALTTIGEAFLFECSSFNSSLTLPSGLLTIRMMFMYGCSSFEQDITLPSTLTSIGSEFMYKCDAMVGTIYVGSLPATVASASSRSFATDNSSADCYTAGMSINASNIVLVTDWLDRFPSSTSAPYRFLTAAFS